MRRLSKTLTIVGVLATISLGGGGNVSAVSTCPIGYTGPSSENICTSSETYECTVENNNQVTVNGQNAQGSVSGSAGGSGAQSGTATNSNGAVFNFQITNEGMCTAVRTVPPTIQPEATPPGVSTPTSATPVVAPVQATPATLANTSGDAAWIPYAVLGAAALAALSARWIVTALKQRNIT